MSGLLCDCQEHRSLKICLESRPSVCELEQSPSSSLSWKSSSGQGTLEVGPSRTQPGPLGWGCPLTHGHCKLPWNAGSCRPRTWTLSTCAYCLWSLARNAYKSWEEVAVTGQQVVEAGRRLVESRRWLQGGWTPRCDVCLCSRSMPTFSLLFLFNKAINAIYDIFKFTKYSNLIPCKL